MAADEGCETEHVRTAMCSRESIHPADIPTTHQNVLVVRHGRSNEACRTIVLWDKVEGRG